MEGIKAALSLEIDQETVREAIAEYLRGELATTVDASEVSLFVHDGQITASLVLDLEAEMVVGMFRGRSMEPAEPLQWSKEVMDSLMEGPSGAPIEFNRIGSPPPLVLSPTIDVPADYQWAALQPTMAPAEAVVEPAEAWDDSSLSDEQLRVAIERRGGEVETETDWNALIARVDAGEKVQDVAYSAGVPWKVLQGKRIGRMRTTPKVAAAPVEEPEVPLVTPEPDWHALVALIESGGASLEIVAAENGVDMRELATHRLRIVDERRKARQAEKDQAATTTTQDRIDLDKADAAGWTLRDDAILMRLRTNGKSDGHIADKLNRKGPEIGRRAEFLRADYGMDEKTLVRHLNDKMAQADAKEAAA